MKELRLWANYYYNIGFNVTHIIPHLNERKAKNPYKSPTNDRHILKNRRQTIEELNSYDWENSTGIGVVLGFNNLRAMDFDLKNWKREINEISPEYFKVFLEMILSKLNLPNNYEWVLRTPSGGFHILFYSEDHPFKVKENLTKAFTLNQYWYYKLKQNDFSHIEFRWNKHLVLPPSLNNNQLYYNFYFNQIPKNIPKDIELSNIINLLDEICCKSKDGDAPGYNTYWSFNHNDPEAKEFLESYGFDEFLDFTPIYLKKDKNNTIPDDWLK